MEREKLRFKVTIQGREVGAVAAIIPPGDLVATFGARGRVPVRGTINGFPYRSSLMPYDGVHMMPVNKALREGAGAGPGDIVEVVMERDVEERTVEAPPQLKKELAKSKTAQANWEKMSFTNKKEMANCIREAKQEETRVRRLAKVVGILKSGEKWTA
jgi:hypothetical protein